LPNLAAHSSGSKYQNAPVAKTDTAQYLAGDKKTKSEVDYRPNNSASRSCGTCANYENPGSDSSSCGKVTGIVQSSAVCDLWAEKPAVRPDDYGDGSHKVEIKIHTGSAGSTINRALTERPNY